MIFRAMTLASALVFSQVSQAIPFTNAYFFGDSLSDVGTVRAIVPTVPGPAYFNGRFTNGPNYADRIARRAGIASAPAILGGTNYAAGGARTDTQFISNNLSVKGQVAQYLGGLGGGTPDPKALHVLWGGANDVQVALEALGAALAMGASQGDAFNAGGAVALAAANNVIMMIDDLLFAGVESLVLPNIPDIGATPRVVGLANSFGNPALIGAATAYSVLINQTIDAYLSALMSPADIYRIDVFGLLAGAPSSGFVNTTDPCILLGPGADCSRYVFWDDFHPTAAAHRIIAREIIAAVPEPGTAILLMAGLIAAGSRHKFSKKW